MNLDFKKLQIKVVENERALYSFAELKDFIDWEVKKIYYIQNCREATGQHCHKIEKEMFVMVKGSCVGIVDHGNGKEDVELKASGDAIIVGNYVWHGFKDFSSDAILLAISSANYNPDRSDYIEDYEVYKEEIGKIRN